MRFISVSDNYDSLNSDTATDSYIVPFKNLINDAYCKDISKKIRSSLDTKRKNGDFVGAFCPYGYEKSKSNGNKLIIDENVRGNIELIFNLYKDGLSIGKIANRLNENGVLSPFEYKRSIGINYTTVFKTLEVSKWEYNTVKRILSNEVYVGRLVQGKQTKVNYKVDKRINNSKNNWVRVDNTHSAIISEDDFNAIQSMMKRDMRSTTKKINGENRLSGFVFCADCGSTMVRRVVNYKEKQYIYYDCSNYLKNNGCFSHSIKFENLEKYINDGILYQIKCLCDFEEIQDELSKQKKSYKNYEEVIINLENEIEEINSIKLRIYTDYTKDILSKDEYIEYKKEQDRKIKDRENSINQASKNLSMGQKENDVITKFKNYISDNCIKPFNRRTLLSLVDKIKIYDKEKIEICFRFNC